jgi:N-methylhydantoinase B
MSTDGYDVIAAEVHRKALENLTNEMSITLLRTSGSPIVVEAKDFSCCLLDTKPEHLGFAAYVSFHLGSSLIGTQAITEIVKQTGDLSPGDGWLVNDPHEGGAMHQGDIAVIMPMFHEGEHMGWGFANMHVLDVGGVGVSGYAPGAHDVFQEGMRFPPIRAIRNGAIDREWELYIAANVRVPGPVLNDIRGMIAACNTGNRKLNEIVTTFGKERYLEYCEINKDLTEQVFRERISRIPDGVYTATDWNEFDGHNGPDLLLRVGLEMEVKGSDLYFRYSGVPQIDGFVNSAKGAMWGQTITGLLTMLAYGDLPINGGVWRPIHIDLGEPGTVVNSLPPAPVSNAHSEVGMRACKMTKEVMNQALSLSDDPVLRSRVAGQTQDGFPGVSLFGPNQHGGMSVVFYLDNCTGQGGGAQSVHDGQDSYGCTCMTGCGLADTEIHEAEDPLLFLWRRISQNSGGPGQYRGGQALEEAYSLAYADGMGGPAFNGCAEVPPRGVGGGFPAGAGGFYILRGGNVPQLLAQGILPVEERLEGVREDFASKVAHLNVHRDDVVVLISGGGGGVGDPLLRSAAQVAADVRDRYITAEHAEAAYGVVLDADGCADEAASATRREDIRRARIGAEPTCGLAQPAQVGVSVERAADGSWSCSYCGHQLTEGEGSWREGAKLVETEIHQRYTELKMFVRERHEEPNVVMREHYCPSCAGSLVVDIVTEDTATLPSPRLGQRLAVA